MGDTRAVSELCRGRWGWGWEDRSSRGAGSEEDSEQDPCPIGTTSSSPQSHCHPALRLGRGLAIRAPEDRMESAWEMRAGSQERVSLLTC